MTHSFDSRWNGPVTANTWRILMGMQPLTNHTHARYTGTDSASNTNIGEQMTTLTFTDEFYPDSKAVDEAFYDENTKTVFVDLHDNMYAYEGVDKEKWERFKKSGDGNGSVGSFYAGSIKRSHGPGTNLGHVRGINYQKVDVRPARAAVGAPQALRTPLAAPAAPVYHSLNVGGTVNAVSGNATSKYVVTFLAGGSRTEKSHEVQAKDEAEALRLFNDLAGLFTTESLKIRSVTHYFE